GGTGGTGGSGGVGGLASPGMLKLHGSIVLAHDATVQCNNYTSSTAFGSLGKFTVISNMTSEAISANSPIFSDDIVKGATRNDEALMDASIFDPAIKTPLIPNLIGGPAVSGFAMANFWNKARVEGALPTEPLLVEQVILAGDFDGFQQVFVVNTSSTDTAEKVTVAVDVHAPISIGMLAPGEVWTTCTPAGMPVTTTFKKFIIDTTPPQISLSGDSIVNLPKGVLYTDAGATAFDEVDGDLTALIVVGGLPIDTSIPGTYVVTYDVADDHGNVAHAERTVNVIQYNGPVIYLPVASVDFGEQNVAGGPTPNAAIEVDNVGTSLMKLGAVLTITGPNAADFSIKSVGFTTRGVKPGEGVFIQVAFDPSVPGLRNATLTIKTNAVNSPVVVVPLQGMGL
ncbi:MAG TPA: DUF5011 domain-containing protein, partial [Candidatus Hydrogenedentes bacterium]|nr:DUF5011 domain-containing protein [Candidatus Hydrogenedentota bacterium]